MEKYNHDQLTGMVASRIESTELLIQNGYGIEQVSLARGLVAPEGVMQLPFAFDEAASLFVPTKAFYDGMQLRYGNEEKILEAVQTLAEGGDLYGVGLDASVGRGASLELRFRYFGRSNDPRQYGAWYIARRNSTHWMTVVGAKAQEGLR